MFVVGKKLVSYFETHLLGTGKWSGGAVCKKKQRECPVDMGKGILSSGSCSQLLVAVIY